MNQNMFVSIFCFLLSTVAATAIIRFGSHRHDRELNEKPHHRILHSLVHEVILARVMYLPDTRPAVAIGELIEFELFDGKVALADVSNIVNRAAGEVTWMGKLRMFTGNYESDVQVDDGYFALTCVESSCIANLQFYSTNAHYRITPANTILEADGSGLYALSEVHLNDELKTGVNMTAILMSEQKALVMKHNEYSISTEAVTASPTAGPSAAPTMKPDDDSILDILVFYTPQAVSSNYGGRYVS